MSMSYRYSLLAEMMCLKDMPKNKEIAYSIIFSHFRLAESKQKSIIIYF